MLLALLCLASLLLIAGYLRSLNGVHLPEWMGFSNYVGPDVGTNRTFQRGKTLWDWMELLIIPFVLAWGAIYFNREEKKIERFLASERTQDSALQTYFDRMTELILHENLRKSKPNDVVRSVARARTHTILRGLDGIRRGVVLRFLFESELIGVKPILNLDGAFLSEIILGSTAINMSHINLEGAILHKSNLLMANLSGSNMKNALLTQAILVHANLSGADLKGASIMWASLIGANLSNADLINADLTDALLDEANLQGDRITPEQLKKTKSLKGAILPDGTKHK